MAEKLLKSIKFPGLEDTYVIPEGGNIDIDLEGANEGEITPVNADTLGGYGTEHYATVEQMKKAAPRNLLDNSDFRNPVNQRGQTSYTSAGTMYTLDRWLIDGTGVILSLIDGGIHIDNAADTTTNRAFYQRLPNGTIVAGKSYTGVIALTDGTIYCGYGVAATSSVNITTNSNDVYFQILDGSEYDSARLVVKKTKNASVAYCALYEGEYTAETLPEYHPKGYAQELLECMRYFFKIGFTAGSYHGYAHTATVARIDIDTIVPMRATPTIAFNDLSVTRIFYNGTNVIPTSVSVLGYVKNKLTIAMATTSLTATSQIVLKPNTGFTLSADL